MYKVTASYDTKSPDGTRGNHPPNNFREISQETFIKGGYVGAVVDFIEHRQITKHNTNIEFLGSYLYTVLHWLHDNTGYAISTDQNKLRFFLFGCNHEWKIKEQIRSNVHVYQCINCEKKSIVDSSD